MSQEIERLKREAARDPGALVRLADTLVAAGRADEAIEWCTRGIAARPDDVQLKLAFGRVLMATGNLAEAQVVLAEAAAQKSAPASRAAAPPRREVEDQTRPEAGYAAEDSAAHATFSGQEFADDAPTYARSQPPMDSTPLPPHIPYREPVSAPQTFDLGRVADALMTGDDGEEAGWGSQEMAAIQTDPFKAAWEAKRARAFVLLWVMLGLVTAGIVAGTIWRAKERAKVLASLVDKGDTRMVEATFDGDIGAREQYAQAVRIDPKARRYFAMVALASARLAADQGEDADASAWAMLRRSEREALRHKQEPDPRTDRELRQARGLLALARGESCPPTRPTADGAPKDLPPGATPDLIASEDGDIAARCAAQRGDIDNARKILEATLKSGKDAENLRALLALGSIELGAGDLDAADGAWRRVQQVSPQHPRAMVGRALVAIERGEQPRIEPPANVRLGATTEAWFHLARGLAALNGGAAEDDAIAQKELDLARKGIVHDGRLALLYGRARLQQGKIGEAEQAMRVAERLDPNDGDVAVLDAEVALAKGFEDKVEVALSQGLTTPRKLAVLGRAQVLTGKYREAASTLDAAMARRPGDATALTYRAIARAHLGDQSGAIRELEKTAVTLKSSAPRYGLGLLAYERHDLLKARNELGKALDHNSESFRARALLGRVLRDLGKPKEALAELEQVAKDAPALATVHEALGRLYLDLGRDREARAELRKVLDIPGRATVEDRLVYAEATIDMGLVDDGARALQEAIDAGALLPRVDRLKLLLQSWRGPKEAAEAAKGLEKARKGSGAHDARLAIQTANAWRRAGDYRKAGDALRAALYGDGLHANLGLGRMELLGTDPSLAEASFRAALKAWEGGPYGVDDQTEARLGLARALLHRKAAADAITALTPCLTDDPQAPEPQFWLAKAYLEQMQPDQARPHAEKATELDDHYADAFQLLGDLNRAVDKAKARAAYKKYLELQPNAPDAKNVKKILATLK